MLTQGDDYPIHQTPDPIAYSGTDRNFYERYWFNGFEPDGSLFWAIGMGCYPHLNILDTALTVLVDGKQHCIRGSRVLNMERMDTSVGPLRLEVVKPLWKLRYVVDGARRHRRGPHDRGPRVPDRGAALHAPRRHARLPGHHPAHAERTLERLDQGRRQALRPEPACDRHSRSLVGCPPDRHLRSATRGAAGTAGLFLAVDAAQFRHARACSSTSPRIPTASRGTRSRCSARTASGPEKFRETSDAQMETRLQKGTLWPEWGRLTVKHGKDTYRVTLEPFMRFQMKGIGYFHPEWFHGRYHGQPLRVAREDFTVAELDPQSLENFHVQMLSKLTLENPDGTQETSVGVFEQAILGDYEPLGVKSKLEISRWDKHSERTDK